MSPSPKVRPPSVRERLLGAARDVITAVGEDNLTLAKVVERAGLTTGAVYSNFANREELIVAVHLEWFASLVERQIRQLNALVDPDLSDSEFAAGLDDLLTAPDHSEARRLRWLRVRALAAADRYPTVNDALVSFQRRLTQGWMDVVVEAQDRQLIDASLDPAAVAVALEFPMFGLILADLAVGLAPSSQAWIDVVQRMIIGLEPPPDAPPPDRLGNSFDSR
jgi:AcrR family transcriptional regulator